MRRARDFLGSLRDRLLPFPPVVTPDPVVAADDPEAAPVVADPTAPTPTPEQPVVPPPSVPPPAADPAPAGGAKA